MSSTHAHFAQQVMHWSANSSKDICVRMGYLHAGCHELLQWPVLALTPFEHGVTHGGGTSSAITTVLVLQSILLVHAGLRAWQLHELPQTLHLQQARRSCFGTLQRTQNMQAWSHQACDESQ